MKNQALKSAAKTKVTKPTGKTAHSIPHTLGELAKTADPDNPRVLTSARQSRLEKSLEEFGDISGITWNRRTNQLVSGHQRVATLFEKHGPLTLHTNGDSGYFAIPGGDPIPVRFVDWDIQKQRRANIAANNPAIGGEFTPQLQDQLVEIRTADAAVFGALAFDHLLTPPPAEPKEVKFKVSEKTLTCPKCSHEWKP